MAGSSAVARETQARKNTNRKVNEGQNEGILLGGGNVQHGDIGEGEVALYGEDRDDRRTSRMDAKQRDQSEKGSERQNLERQINRENVLLGLGY